MEERVNEVEFNGIWKGFPGNPKPILSGLDLKVQSGDIHVLIGYSGTGKSVTLKHLLGLMQPDRGEIIVRGQKMSQLSDIEIRDLRKNFGMLFQGAALFDSLNVYENVAFPLREHRPGWTERKIKTRVRDLLEMVDLGGSDNKMPSELSGGMKKRVGFARSIALEPKILLFDEPTTGLDPVTAETIDLLIESLTRKLSATAFVISHDIHAAMRIADKLSMLFEGKIVSTASPEEFKKVKVKVVQEFLDSAGVYRG